MILTTLSTVLVIGLAHGTKANDCTAPGGKRLTEAQMNPVEFKAYVQDSGLRSVDDVTCCFPKSYLENFVIIHSSQSAQSSTVNGHRVLVYNKMSEGKQRFPTKPLQMVLSLNGGTPDLNNADNIEIFFNNHREGESELYDADFTGGKFHFSNKNPEACVACHGNRGQVAAGGVKPIFEVVDQWTRAVQGVHGCGTESEFARAVERRSQKTFQTNPRYRCLNQKIATKHHFKGEDTSTPDELLVLDIALNQVNARRVARYLRTTPDYERFKFAAIGALLCEFKAPGNDSPKNDVRTMRDFLPFGVIKKMTDVGTITPTLRMGNAFETANALLERSEADAKRTDASLGKAAAALDRGETPDFDFYRGPLNTCSLGARAAHERMKEVKQSLKGPPTLDLYKIDAAVRGFRGSRFSPLFRYVFEARGVPIDSVSMEPLSEAYPMTPGFIANAMLDLEPRTSPLGRLRDQFYRAGAAGPVFPNAATFGAIEKKSGKPAAREALRRGCTQLAQMSRKANVNAPGAASPLATGTADTAK